MTQEYKELLLKDLCSRLPYGVKVYNKPYTFALDIFEVNSTISETILEIIKEGWKPYLRTMSSMTGEESKEYFSISTGSIRGDMIAKIDFYLKHHFDFRLTSEGLSMIEAGLALEAPEGMYNIK